MSQHELNQVVHGQRTAHAVFKLMNATILDPELPPEKLITAGGEIIHELGTARMGPDPRSSVVDSYGQTWEVGNLVLMDGAIFARSEEHTSELQSLMRISYAVFCLKKQNKKIQHN